MHKLSIEIRHIKLLKKIMIIKVAKFNDIDRVNPRHSKQYSTIRVWTKILEINYYKS